MMNSEIVKLLKKYNLCDDLSPTNKFDWEGSLGIYPAKMWYFEAFVNLNFNPKGIFDSYGLVHEKCSSETPTIQRWNVNYRPDVKENIKLLEALSKQTPATNEDIRKYYDEYLKAFSGNNVDGYGTITAEEILEGVTQFSIFDGKYYDAKKNGFIETQTLGDAFEYCTAIFYKDALTIVEVYGNQLLLYLPQSGKDEDLSLKETNKQILELWKDGLTAEEIAGEVHRSPGRVKNVVTALRKQQGSEKVPYHSGRKSKKVPYP